MIKKLIISIGALLIVMALFLMLTGCAPQQQRYKLMPMPTEESLVAVAARLGVVVGSAADDPLWAISGADAVNDGHVVTRVDLAPYDGRVLCR